MASPANTCGRCDVVTHAKKLAQILSSHGIAAREWGGATGVGSRVYVGRQFIGIDRGGTPHMIHRGQASFLASHLHPRQQAAFREAMNEYRQYLEEVYRGNPSDERAVKREWREWTKLEAERLEEIERAFAQSPAIRGGVGAQAQMAIKSGELSDTKYGKYRVTFFGPDGPHGHITKDTDHDIAQETKAVLKPPIVPMTDDEVMEWTSTEEFERGSKLTSYMQGENTLRWLAGKAGRREWADGVIAEANEVGSRGGTVNIRNKPYDPEALDDAIAVMSAALRELPLSPVQNPPTGWWRGSPSARAMENPPAGRWWAKHPTTDQPCYPTKSAALAKFLDANHEIVENYGGADYRVGTAEFDAVNHKHNAKARTIAEAAWAAMPAGKPFCLDRIDLEALNDTSPARDAGVEFRLPDVVYESDLASKEAAHYAGQELDPEADPDLQMPDWIGEGVRVIFAPSPASMMLYSDPPAIGATGVVTTVNLGGGRKSSYLAGPGGGLVYVDWDLYPVQGVSPNDLEINQILERAKRAASGKTATTRLSKSRGNPESMLRERWTDGTTIVIERGAHGYTGWLESKGGGRIPISFGRDPSNAHEALALAKKFLRGVHGKNNPDDDFDTDILGGMESAIWVTSYADWVEEQDRATQKELGPGAGGDWVDCAPPAPQSALLAAEDLYKMVERANGKTPGELFQRACEVDGCKWDEGNANLFGHYVAMQAMGHGVSWFDDHKEFPLKTPHFEAHSFDGQEVEWSPQIRSRENGGR